MNRCSLFLASLLAAAAPVAASPAAAAQATPTSACAIHVYPADGVHSVGEDFDAVHRVDQDLRDYYKAAGRSLDWLVPSRQLALIGDVPVASLLGLAEGSRVLHSEPVTRLQALNTPAPAAADGCVVQVLLPQIMLERGGLAVRSLRLFGIVRRYQNGALASGYTGFAAVPLTGFKIKSPADADSSTAIVEQSYRGAVETLLRNSVKPNRK